jgi:hypothetical protein
LTHKEILKKSGSASDSCLQWDAESVILLTSFTMHASNPLRSLFDVFGRPTGNHVTIINRRALDELTKLLSVELESTGRCILLRAPRAGFGKTHLLSQVLEKFKTTHEFILLSLADGSSLQPGTVLADVLRRLCRSLPDGGGLTELDMLARRVLALGLEPLVRSGEVPCQDRDSAIAALRERAIETFDFHHPNAVTAHWARDNFNVLGPRLGFELSHRVDAPQREAVGWVEALFRFASTPIDQPSRIGLLIEAATGNGASLERLGALLQLLSPMRRMILLADELEGLSADPQSALRLASFVTTLRQTSDSADIILAINDDLWESAFRPRLSGGLQDRLGEWVIELKHLTDSEIEMLIENRVPGRGAEIAAKLDLAPEDRYSRNVLRRAAAILDEILEKNPQASPAKSPSPFEASPSKAQKPSDPPKPFQQESDPAKPSLDSQPETRPGILSEEKSDSKPKPEATAKTELKPAAKSEPEPASEPEPEPKPLSEASLNQKKSTPPPPPPADKAKETPPPARSPQPPAQPIKKRAPLTKQQPAARSVSKFSRVAKPAATNGHSRSPAPAPRTNGNRSSANDKSKASENQRRIEKSTGWSFQNFVEDLEPVQTPFPDPSAPLDLNSQNGSPFGDAADNSEYSDSGVDDGATSRVDELLRQFRARYGNS